MIIDPFRLYGVRVIASPCMVENGEPYEVPRTWKERLLTLPWKPFKTTKTIVPLIPKREAVQLPDGTVVMHPEVINDIRQMVNDLNNTPDRLKL